MRIRLAIVAATLILGAATPLFAQPEPRPEPRVRVERFRYPLEDRMRSMERSSSRAGRLRMQMLNRTHQDRLFQSERLRTRVRERALDETRRYRERGFDNLLRERDTRQRAMERIRDRLRVEQRLTMRRRWRTI